MMWNIFTKWLKSYQIFRKLRKIEGFKVIIAAGSVDGVLTSAALGRFFRLYGRNYNVLYMFTEAFRVNEVSLDITTPAKIFLVDLAVNIKDPEMTRQFIKKLQNGGHEIVAIIDEHNRQQWLEVMGSLDGLIVEPQSQSEGVFKSSGAVLMDALLPHVKDSQILNLLTAADAADHGNFYSFFGGMANAVIKSNISDSYRRMYLAEHLSRLYKGDPDITKWIGEYNQIIQNNQAVIIGKKEITNKIVRIEAINLKIDVTAVMMELYKNYSIVIVSGICIKDNPIVSIGTNRKDINLIDILKSVGIAAGGFAQKANIKPEEEAVAVEAIKQAIQ